MKLANLAAWLSLVLSYAVAVSALRTFPGSVGGAITTNQVLPDLALLGSAKVWLNGGEYVAYIEDDGSFSFPDVATGSHILQVASNLYAFDQIRIDVTPSGHIVASRTHTGASWSKQGPSVETPLVLQARGKYDFYLPREGFNYMSLLSNPMLLMSGFSMVLFFVMPKLMKHVPEEALEEAKNAAASQEAPQLPQMPDISQNLANWFAPPAPAKGKKN